MKKIIGLLVFILISTLIFAQNYDLMTSLTMEVAGKAGVAVPVKGFVINKGFNSVTSFDLNYQVDDNQIFTANISSVNIPQNGKWYFTHPTNFTPTNTNGFHKIKCWASNLNGNPDQNPSNDADSFFFFVNYGITGSKNVLLESVVSVKDGESTDAYAKIDEMLNTYPKTLVPVNYQTWGEMATLDFIEINNDFKPATSTGLIDRTFWKEYNEIAVPRYDWSTRIAERLSSKTPVNISFQEIKYNPSTSAAEITAKFEFVDAMGGDIRATCLLTEDWVTGSKEDYQQANNYDAMMGHPFFNRGNPVYPMFFHFTARMFNSGIWGDWIDLKEPGFRKVSKDTVIIKQFSKRVIPDNWNRHQMYAIVFVCYWDENIARRQVLNVIKAKLTTTSIEEANPADQISMIYPNPVENTGIITFSTSQTTDIQLSIFDVMGRKVLAKTEGSFAPGEHHVSFDASKLSKGSYLAVLEFNGQKHTVKFIK